MKLKLYSFLFLLFFGITNAQQLNCTVNVNADQITITNKQIFNTLEKSLSDFINKTDWTGVSYKQDEKINCSMYITVTAYDSNQFTATIQVQSSRPVYNSTYSSPILNFNDKDFSFKYNEFENINFNPTSFESNLVSVIAFYSYLIIGMDADTFSRQGGSKYLETAQDVANLAITGGYKGWGQADGTQNRFFLINDMLSSTFISFREALFEYHFEGLDLMHNDLKSAKLKIKEAINTLGRINETRPNAFITRVFFDAKSDEIVSVFSAGPSIDCKDLIGKLNNISPINSSKWAEIKY
ncbi:MAG: DUF4835 family protein [Flavobacteriaceae bacterium]|jgi:hypothetical protein|nr:DUF4835 family protein [Flavobacteriaceae bacterium]